MRPGDLGMYDSSYVQAHAAKFYAPLKKWYRVRAHGWENLPRAPFLGVGNHSGGILMPDALAWVGEYHTSRLSPPLVTLAHDGLFDLYPRRLATALSKLGAVRAGHQNARDAFARGHAVQVYPGGDDDACRTFAQRNTIVFAGRTGYVRLAQEAKVPIVPVVSRGAHSGLVILSTGKGIVRFFKLHERLRLTAWPLSLCLPWIVWFGPAPGYLPFPSRMTLTILPPIDPSGSIPAVDEHVRGRMQAHLDERGDLS
jgi:1-acyl-sn-glycerol-3-phosphate acyltransferase